MGNNYALLALISIPNWLGLILIELSLKMLCCWLFERLQWLRLKKYAILLLQIIIEHQELIEYLIDVKFASGIKNINFWFLPMYVSWYYVSWYSRVCYLFRHGILESLTLKTCPASTSNRPILRVYVLLLVTPSKGIQCSLVSSICIEKITDKEHIIWLIRCRKRKGPFTRPRFPFKHGCNVECLTRFCKRTWTVDFVCPFTWGTLFVKLYNHATTLARDPC